MRKVIIIAAVIISAGFQLAHGQVMHSAFDAVTDSAVFYSPSVRATGDLLNRRMDTNVKILVSTDYDTRFVPSFVAHRSNAAGQYDPPWTAEWAGKLLESMALSWAYTKNVSLKTRLDDFLSKLMPTQEADGYFGNYPVSERFTSWDMWCQKYVMIGLLLYYQATGDTTKLRAARRMGIWLHDQFFASNGLSNFLSGPWGGLASASAVWAINDGYRWTGEQRIQDLCDSVMRLMQTASNWDGWNTRGLINGTQDTLHARFGGGKSYETFGSICGIAGQYRITGNPKYLKTAENAWLDLYSRHLYPVGQYSQHENTTNDYDLSWTAPGAEACATFQWLTLNWELFRLTGTIKYADEMERTIYNAVLAGQSPSDGGVVYDVTVNGSMSYMWFASPSEPRAIGRIPWYAIGLFGGNPMISLYLPGTYVLPVKSGSGVVSTTMRVVTDFPSTGNVTVTLTPQSSATFTLRLRVPWWSDSYRATVGGQVYTGVKGTFLDISRTWQPGDQVSIVMQMPFKAITYGYGRYPGKVTIQRGPQVLSISSAVSGSSLPSGWIGDQIYVIQKANGGTQTMVPYADAGQRGSFSTVIDSFGIYNPPVGVITPLLDEDRLAASAKIIAVEAGLWIAIASPGFHQVTLSDAQGRLLRTFQGANAKKYRVSGLISQGVYFANIQINGQTFSRRIVCK